MPSRCSDSRYTVPRNWVHNGATEVPLFQMNDCRERVPVCACVPAYPFLFFFFFFQFALQAVDVETHDRKKARGRGAERGGRATLQQWAASKGEQKAPENRSSLSLLFPIHISHTHREREMDRETGKERKKERTREKDSVL